MGIGLIYFVQVIVVIAIASLIGCFITVIDDKWSDPLARRLRESRPKRRSPLLLVKNLWRDESDPLGELGSDEKKTFQKRLTKYVAEAGYSLSVIASLMVLEIVTLLIGGLWLTRSWKITIPLALLPMVLNFLWVSVRRRRRIAAVEAQLPEALHIICSAMRAGQSLDGSIAVASTSLPGVLGAELKLLSQSLCLGLALEDALRDFTTRLASGHIEYVAAAIRIQHRLGGDLCKLLEKVSENVRQRLEVINQVHSLSAEGRMSGTVLMIMPVAAFGMMYYLTPDYISVLFEDRLGQKLLWTTVGLQILGIIVIRKVCTATA